MTKNELVIPAKQKGLSSLIINIPDKPENYNRKFMVYVTLEPGNNGQMGVGLGAIARVMIETKAKKDSKALGGPGIAIKPGTIVIKGKPGATFSESIMVQNNEKSSASFTQTKLSDFYPEIKFARYQSSGFTLMPSKTWVDAVSDSDMEPGKEQDLKVTGTIPADAKVGGKYEEALFLKPKLSVKPEGMSDEDFEKYQTSIMSFLRIQYIIE